MMQVCPALSQAYQASSEIGQQAGANLEKWQASVYKAGISSLSQTVRSPSDEQSRDLAAELSS